MPSREGGNPPTPLEEGAPVRGCPLAILIAEHQTSRLLVAGLSAAADTPEKADKSAKKSIMDNFRGLKSLYPNHVWKEDYLLFPMTNKILNTKNKRTTWEIRSGGKTIGPDVHIDSRNLLRS